MSGFEAATATPALDFNFAPYSDAKGTIPEPSQDAIEVFQKTLTAMAPDGDPTRLGELAPDEQDEAKAKLFDAIVAFCGGAITLEDLKALPFRTLQAFSGWLFGSFKNPT